MATTFLMAAVLACSVISSMAVASTVSAGDSNDRIVATSTVEQIVFRNTTRFKYVHMTMIEQIDEHKYLFAFQASKIGEGHKDQRIVLMRSTDGGNTFGEARDIITADNVPVWGPCLFHHPMTNVTYLYYAQGVPQNVRAGGRHFPGGDIYVVNSTDFGLTWSSPMRLMTYDSPTRGNVSKMTANKPVFLTKDMTQWALPFWQEAHPTNHNDTGPLCAGVLVTTDMGRSYQPVGFIENPNTWLIENTVVPVSELPESDAFGSSNLTLIMYFRVKAPIDHIHQSISTNGGKDWSMAVPIGIKNPDSKTSAAVRIGKDGVPQRVMLSCNPSLTLNRRLLVSYQSRGLAPLPTTLDFGYTQVLHNTTNETSRDTWSYPTVMAVKGSEWGMAPPKFLQKLAVPPTANATIQTVWAVSFTAWGTQGGILAWTINWLN